MVLAHAAQLAQDVRWSVSTTHAENAVELRWTSGDPAVVERAMGMGFFGFMANHDHHREHHLMMARGKDTHGH